MKNKLCNLKREGFVNVSLNYSNGEKLELLKRKGVFTFEWFDNIRKLDDTALPLKEAFYSTLNEEGISDEDYQYAQTVWRVFECKTMRDYHDLYLLTDVLLLADIFENFRAICIKNYKLDPAWYYSAPGLSWDTLLKMTKIELELLLDLDMHLFFEKAIRGGISIASIRYVKANNKYMCELYNTESESTFIVYLDSNNLYGWAMSQKLPISGFKWIDPKELENWESYPCML